MRLLRIRIDNFRAVEAYEVSLDSRGATVIEAPNEVGKTSLIEAVELLLDRKDSSGAKQARSVQPAGRDVGSLVEVELRCGDYHLTCRKQFNRNTMTELTIHAPSREQHTGEEAHDRRREIVENEVDLALMKALWFKQGRELDSPRLHSSDALATALDAEAGGKGNGTDDALLEQVREEFERYYTPTGQDGKALREVDEAAEAARSTFDDLTETLDELEQDIEELADVERRVTSLLDEEEELAAQVEEYSQKIDTIKSLRQRVETVKARVESAQSKYERADADLERREELEREIEGLNSEIFDLDAALDPKGDDLSTRTETLNERRPEVEEAEELHRTARSTLAAADDVVTYLPKIEERERLRVRQQQVEEVLDAASEAEAFLQDCEVTAAGVQELRGAAEDLRAARARLEVGSPSVELTAARDLEFEVDEEEHRLSEGDTEDYPVHDDLEISIPTTVNILVRAGTSVSDLQDNVDSAQRRVNEARESMSISDLAEAEDILVERDKHAATLDTRDSDLEDALAGLTRDELSDQLFVLDKRIDALETDIDISSEDANLAEAVENLDTARKEEEAAAQKAKEARATRDALKEVINELRMDVTAGRTKLETKREQLDTQATSLSSA